MALEKCPHCGATHAVNAMACPNCGAQTAHKAGTEWLTIGCISLGMLAVCGGIAAMVLA
jgi:hypothetical protein